MAPKRKRMAQYNLFAPTPHLNNEEHTTTLLSRPSTKIFHIVSPPHFQSDLFCQNEDEWVSLLQGEATLAVEGELHALKAGDTLLIPANTPHQVTDTSEKPLAIWLAVHLYM